MRHKYYNAEDLYLQNPKGLKKMLKYVYISLSLFACNTHKRHSENNTKNQYKHCSCSFCASAISEVGSK